MKRSFVEPVEGMRIVGYKPEGKSVLRFGVLDEGNLKGDFIYNNLIPLNQRVEGNILVFKNGVWEMVTNINVSGDINHETSETEISLPKIETEISLPEKVWETIKVPEKLVMNDLKWKCLVRGVVKSKNILLTGYTGTGKTFAASCVAKSLGYNFEKFNMGATQDPRATLIGNTHYKKDKGTFFNPSRFIKAITKPNTVILLDELSRAHPDAWNILMTALDSTQRYIALDESEDSEVIKIHPSVCFIATANIGAEFTATNIIDRALIDRFITVEMDLLNKNQQMHVLKTFTNISNHNAEIFADFYQSIVDNYKSESPELSIMVSTRMMIEAAEMVSDGFSLPDSAELAIYPFFSDDGANSERVFVKQIAQKYFFEN